MHGTRAEPSSFVVLVQRVDNFDVDSALSVLNGHSVHIES